MAGMYPENEEVTIFGEKVQWPGVDKSGKFTNGSFSNPLEKPSFIPAQTINLILDNLSGLITKLGGKPDNKSATQLADVIKLAGQGDSTDKDKNKGLGLVKTANRSPNMQEASKNESWAASPNWVWNLIMGNGDAEVKKHIANAMRSQVKGDSSIFCYRGEIAHDKLNTATACGMYTVKHSGQTGALLVFNAPGSVGYIQFLKNDWRLETAWQYRNALNNDIRHSGAWRSLATAETLAAHTGNKNNPHGVTKAQIGLGDVDNTKDADKGVKYAASAKNADTVGGYRAGNGVNMLVPVVAFNVGENAGYIKLGNGLIVQWGYSGTNVPEAIFPIRFSNTNYKIIVRVIWRSNQSAAEGHSFVDKLPDRIIRNGRAGFPIEYIAIGI